MDDLEEYIEKAFCRLSECKYWERDCSLCVESMLKEHDEKVKADVIDELLNKLNELSEYARPVGWSKKVEIITMSTVRDIAEQLKVGVKNDNK